MEDKKVIRARAIPGKHGGTLRPVSPGEPSPRGSGRKSNPFRSHIQELSEKEFEVVAKGRLLDEDGNPTGDLVPVSIVLPGALAVVAKAFRQAAKGNASARRWLTETGWGKTLNFAEDADSPLGLGFAVILPDNER